jgi:Fe-S cluster biosynthesis and repair protein YggX
MLSKKLYNEKDLNENVMKEWYDWLERYSIRINEETLDTERKEAK